MELQSIFDESKEKAFLDLIRAKLQGRWARQKRIKEMAFVGDENVSCF